MNFRKEKESPDLDMNPMVDMAFLLVSFFMLTTTFKTVDPVQINKPASSAQIKVPENNVIKISIGSEGRVFFGVDNKFVREVILRKISLMEDMDFSPAEVESYALASSVGVPFAQLNALLRKPVEEQADFPQTGIPCHSSDRNELRQWIVAARMINPNQRVSIIADKETPYQHVRCVIDLLQELRIYRFNLVTDLE